MIFRYAIYLALILISALALPKSANAEHWTRDTILQFCIPASTAKELGDEAELRLSLCSAYISGILEGVQFTRAAFKLNEVSLPDDFLLTSIVQSPECIPNAVSNRDIAIWVSGWINETPEDTSKFASQLVLEAVHEGYCENERGQ